jgi:hypothetical protein
LKEIQKFFFRKFSVFVTHEEIRVNHDEINFVEEIVRRNTNMITTSQDLFLMKYGIEIISAIKFMITPVVTLT